MPSTKGHVLHTALGYDLLVWLLLGGRERAFRAKLVQLAQLAPGEVVLDVGCGSGTLAIAARQRVGPTGVVHGIDPSPEMVARAQRKARKAHVDVTFTAGVAEKLEFANEHFDVVLSTMMLHHVPRDLRAACLSEARRVVRPGGRVFVVDFGRSSKERKGIIAHFHGHRGIVLDDLVRLVTDAGFVVAETGAVGVRNVNYVLATAGG